MSRIDQRVVTAKLLCWVLRSSHFLSTLRRPNMQNIRTWNSIKIPQRGSKIYVDVQHGVYHYKCNKSFKVSYAKRNNYCMSAHCLKLWCLHFYYFQSWCQSCLASESRVVLNGSSRKSIRVSRMDWLVQERVKATKEHQPEEGEWSRKSHQSYIYSHTNISNISYFQQHSFSLPNMHWNRICR